MESVLAQVLQMPHIIFVVGGLIAITAIITEGLRKSHQISVENQLKRDLIAQGRSAEDVERILSASARGRRKKNEC